MPTYEVAAPDGRRFQIEGETPPGESDLDEIFKARPAPSAQPEQTPAFDTTTTHAEPTAADHLDLKRGSSPIAGIGHGLSTLGKGAVAGLGDLGRIAFRPITDELYPEQAVRGKLPDAGENVDALLASEKLPAKDLRALPKSLQMTGSAAQGLIETAPRMAAVAGLQVAGVPAPVGAGMVFGATEQGFDPKQAIVAAALPFIGKFSGRIAEEAATAFGVDSATAMNWIKGLAATAGPAGVLAADQEREISKLPKDQREQARIDMWANIAGQVALGPMGVEFEKKGAQNAIQDLNAIQKEATLRNGQSTTDKNQLQIGTQTQPAINRETTANDVAAIERRDAEAANARLENLAKINTEKSGDTAKKMPGEQVGSKESDESKILEGADAGRPALRTSSIDAENIKEAPAEIGARPPQERQRIGQSVGESGTQDPLSTLISSWQDEKGNAVNETVVGTVGKVSQLLQDLSNPEKQARSAGDLLRLLQEELPKLPEEKSNQIKKAIYATINLNAGALGQEGMGAAKLGEVGQSGDSSVTGLAERVRKEREAAGQTAATQPGEGIAPEASVERGRALLPHADPEQIMSDFEASNKFSSDDVAIVRAKAEQLAIETNLAEEKFGTDSPEFKAAFKVESDWAARTKKMQTEWAKSGHAQQGEVDIDTGTFSGLARAFKEDTGKDFNPKQAQTAKRKAGKVKEATGQADTAKSNLYDHLERESNRTNAEQRAFDAANKTVREWAIRRVQAEIKARVAKPGKDAELAKIQKDAAEKGFQAAQKVAREAAVKLAKAENETRIKEATAKTNEVQDKAAKDALDAASKTVRDAATRLAEAETKAQVAKAGREKKAAEADVKAAKKIAEAANKQKREAAIRAAKTETALRVARADVPGYAWKKAREYINDGMDDFNNIRNKVATDMGLSVEKVTAALAQDKRSKYLADEVWKKQQIARKLKQQAKQWLKETSTPAYLRAIQSVPKILFSLKVGFHGTVALGTHAPMVAFQPRFWNTYIRDFGKMYRMVGSRTYYERQVQDLIRRPNYITARRAGLVNDPFMYEDFNSPDTAKYFGGLTGMGNRGYSVLKILRQDMFDQMWSKLPKTAQVPEVAKAVADGLNHATGVVKGSAPGGANLALFAPRLEASRVAWLAVDPVKALKSFISWEDATQGEKVFAINQVKEKAWVAGTLFGMLAINAGFLAATGSKQKINLDDPMKNDFLKFKAFGMSFSYGNAMISMARLPVRLYQIRQSNGGKLRNVIHPDESSYTVLGEYARSQLSPFASLASSLWFKSDWQNRPLPNSNRPVPKRQALQGVKPYTWPEFWSEQVLPIPIEEATREVWQHGLGMSPNQIKHMRKAMATIAVMSATGGRLVEDTSVK